MKKTQRLINGLLILIVMILLSSKASAQDAQDRTPRPSIRVTGEATITAKPDQALIDIGVVTQAQTAQIAATQNAQKQEAVIAALRRVMGAGADIKTISYSLNPDYRYPERGGQPTITGYSASNTVQVKTSDLTQVGKIIDIATQTGANNIQSLRFMLKDEEAA
ncbi:MAG TPA: SIMPL domain-containing protein, partial [Blastocatellia bacterium]